MMNNSELYNIIMFSPTTERNIYAAYLSSNQLTVFVTIIYDYNFVKNK